MLAPAPLAGASAQPPQLQPSDSATDLMGLEGLDFLGGGGSGKNAVPNANDTATATDGKPAVDLFAQVRMLCSQHQHMRIYDHDFASVSHTAAPFPFSHNTHAHCALTLAMQTMAGFGLDDAKGRESDSANTGAKDDFGASALMASVPQQPSESAAKLIAMLPDVSFMLSHSLQLPAGATLTLPG